MEAVADGRGLRGWPLSEALGVSEGGAPSESVAVAEVVAEGVCEDETETVGVIDGETLAEGVRVTLLVCDSEAVWLAELVCVPVWLAELVCVPVWMGVCVMVLFWLGVLEGVPVWLGVLLEERVAEMVEVPLELTLADALALGEPVDVGVMVDVGVDVGVMERDALQLMLGVSELDAVADTDDVSVSDDEDVIELVLVDVRVLVDVPVLVRGGVRLGVSLLVAVSFAVGDLLATLLVGKRVARLEGVLLADSEMEAVSEPEGVTLAVGLFEGVMDGVGVLLAVLVRESVTGGEREFGGLPVRVPVGVRGIASATTGGNDTAKKHGARRRVGDSGPLARARVGAEDAQDVARVQRVRVGAHGVVVLEPPDEVVQEHGVLGAGNAGGVVGVPPVVVRAALVQCDDRRVVLAAREALARVGGPHAPARLEHKVEGDGRLREVLQQLEPRQQTGDLAWLVRQAGREGEHPPPTGLHR